MGDREELLRLLHGYYYLAGMGTLSKHEQDWMRANDAIAQPFLAEFRGLALIRAVVETEKEESDDRSS